MLKKVLGYNKGTAPQDALQPEEGLRALKIVHPGGTAEYYYMAIPAARIIDKYPSFILARPEIFHRPWDSTVRPEEILFPGQKFYVVPRRTVKKLKLRSKKTNTGLARLGELNASQQKDSFSAPSIMAKSSSKKKARNHKVMFFDIDNTPKQESNSAPSDKKLSKKSETCSKKGFHSETDGKNSRAQYKSTWEPSLTSINETSD